MTYNYEGTFNIDQLSEEIRQSSITIALDFMNYVVPNLEINFKANLSTQEEIVLNDLVVAHTPQVIEDQPLQVEVLQPKDSNGIPIIRNSPFSDTGGFRFRGSSFTGTVAGNTTQSVDVQISQERWINGGLLIVDNIGTNDQGTFQVVDKDYLYAGVLYPSDFNGIPWSTAQPNGVILDEFINGYYVPLDKKLEINLAYPARILSGLYIRLIYTSTHEDGCTLKCNMYLHWKAE